MVDTWELCKIHRPSKPTEYGKHWTWVKFSKVVERSRLVESSEIIAELGMNPTTRNREIVEFDGYGEQSQFR